MRGDIGFVELTQVDHVLYERVVVGDLSELAVAQQVRARVSDVREREAGATPQQRRQRGSHAVELGVGVHHLAQLVVRLSDRLFEDAEQIGRRVVVVEGGQRCNRHGARDIARGVPAHAVGDC